MNWDLRASLVRMKTDNLRVHSDCRTVSNSGSNRERRVRCTTALNDLKLSELPVYELRSASCVADSLYTPSMMATAS